MAGYPLVGNRFRNFSLVFYICWWFYWRRIEKLANDLQDWLTASLWSAIPFSIITLTVVVLAYLSDPSTKVTLALLAYANCCCINRLLYS